jgi:hypothetical protein
MRTFLLAAAILAAPLATSTALNITPAATDAHDPHADDIVQVAPEPTPPGDDGIPRAINGQIIDTHQWWNVEFEKYDRPIKIVVYPTYEALRKSYEKIHPKSKGDGILGFSEPWKEEKCTLHIVDPKVEYQAAILGHEMMHCIYGAWHDPFGAPPIKPKQSGSPTEN